MKNRTHVRKSSVPLIPEPLRRGDTVGIVATSGPIGAERLNAGLSFLERLGFRAITGCNVIERSGYLAGTDGQRCQDLNAMLSATEIRAIVFARGGYGVMRILESVDFGAVTRNPKLMLGMSDVTALQLSLYQRCGLVTLAGPMVAGQMSEGLDALSEEWLVRSMIEPLAGRNLVPLDGPYPAVLRPGRAFGVLLGGCLSLVCALIGTSHCPDFTGAILMLEDVNEPLYRVDRMLMQLKLGGILDSVGGIVLGHFVAPDGCNTAPEVGNMILELTWDHPIPVMGGYPHGHTLPNLTIPYGVPVEMVTDPPRLSVTIG